MANFPKNLRQERTETGEELVASLQPGLELEGRIKVTSGTIEVNTHFKGEIVSEGSVIVESEGEVEAGIEALRVTVSGKVKGNIHASDRLEIKEHAVVLGDIHTHVLVVGAGGYFDGHCHMPGPEVDKQNKEVAPPERPAEL